MFVHGLWRLRTAEEAFLEVGVGSLFHGPRNGDGRGDEEGGTRISRRRGNTGSCVGHTRAQISVLELEVGHAARACQAILLAPEQFHVDLV